MIYYHGTTEENAKNILEKGFNKETYFTWDLHSALQMGGMWIFSIYFAHLDIKNGHWEYRCEENISPDRILYLRKFSIDCLYDNDEAQTAVRRDTVKELYCASHPLNKVVAVDIIFCEYCKGLGQMNSPYPYSNSLKDKNYSIVVCPKCKGYGYLAMKGEYNG